jgi:hypothetical protein
MRLKREKTELYLKQLRDRQSVEKDVDRRKLEMRQAIEQRKLEDEIEIAKLEKRYAVEEERRLYADERLYEHADCNERTEVPKFEYRYASPAILRLREQMVSSTSTSQSFECLENSFWATLHDC